MELTLVSCQALLGGLAVLVGRGILPLWASLLLNTSVVSTLLVVCLRARSTTGP